MKKLLIAVAALAVLAGGTVLAKGGTCPGARKDAKGCGGKCFGTVESVDAAKGTVTIKMKDETTMVVAVTKDTRIMKGKETLELGKLAAGTTVKVVCAGDEKACTATKIVVVDKSRAKEGKKAGKGCPMKDKEKKAKE
jgi:hypothetical protein